jgi:hypothetical protein
VGIETGVLLPSLAKARTVTLDDHALDVESFGGLESDLVAARFESYPDRLRGVPALTARPPLEALVSRPSAKTNVLFVR